MEQQHTVLVADDEPSIRALVTKFLERCNYEVITASDGAEAIEKVDARPFDAIVLDVMMPRVNGFQVLEHLQARHPDLARRTIFLTAYPRTAIKEMGGSCRVLSKPFELDQLLSAVHECIEGAAAI